MNKTVSATCACGAKFDREVKRGRPQKWCPTCAAVPFYERNCTPVVIEGETFLVGNEFGEVAPERIVNENDPLDLVRVEVEAGMAVINAAHKARYFELVAGGMDTSDAAVKAQAETFAATTELYGNYRKTKVMMPKEEEAA